MNSYGLAQTFMDDDMTKSTAGPKQYRELVCNRARLQCASFAIVWTITHKPITHIASHKPIPGELVTWTNMGSTTLMQPQNARDVKEDPTRQSKTNRFVSNCPDD